MSVDTRLIISGREISEEIRCCAKVQFGWVLWTTVSLGDLTNVSAEILSQSFLRKAIVSNSGIYSAVHSFTVIQHFLCRPRSRPPSKLPRRMVLERSCPYAWYTGTIRVFVFLKLPEDVPVGPQGSLSRSAPSLWSCAPSRRCREVSSDTWFESLDPFYESASMLFVLQP